MKEMLGATPGPVGAVLRPRADAGRPGVPMRNTPSPLCRQCVGLAALGLMLAGCASTATVVPPPRAAAHLSVENQTPFAWQLGVTGTEAGPVRKVRIEARGSVELELPGDTYTIEQSMLAAAGHPVTTRSLVARLDAGQTYRWPLATLMSAPGDEDAGARQD